MIFYHQIDTLRVGDDADINEAHSGYLQWRPIVYTSPNKVVSNSTKTFEYDITNVTSAQTVGIFNSSLLLDSYGLNLSNFQLKASAENVSFGWSGDGFYKKTNYSSWLVQINIICGIIGEKSFIKVFIFF